MISIILLEPKKPGNVGAVARVIKNFDFFDLIVINPQCDIKSKEAMDRSAHAKNILENAKIEHISYLKNFDYIIATTSKLGTDYNIPRSPITPAQLADKLSKTKNRKIGIIFGPEGTGLSNELINICDFIVTIPSSIKYPTLNVSHSVGIILYELFQKSREKKQGEQIIPVSKKEKEHLLKIIYNKLDKMHFATKEKKETQKLIWKRILGKSMLTKREAFALFGFFRKLK